MTREEIAAGIDEEFEQMFPDQAKKTATDETPIFAPHGRGWVAGLLDSLERVEFTMAVEERFGVEIDDVTMAMIDTKKGFVDIVEAKTSSCGAN